MAVVICGDWNSPPVGGSDFVNYGADKGGGAEGCLVLDDYRVGLAAQTTFTSSYENKPLKYSAQDFGTLFNRFDPPYGLPGAPPGGWMDVIDYLYHTPALVSRRTLEEPRFDPWTEGSEVPPAYGIPNSRYPSDHIALVAEYGWVEQ